MIVDAEIWDWTPQGMRRRSDSADGYIAVRDVERLLEEAHARGKRQAEDAAEAAAKGWLA